jgi:hypothetical protein
VSTWGGDTASSRPSLLIPSISTDSWSSPLAWTSYRSVPPEHYACVRLFRTYYSGTPLVNAPSSSLPGGGGGGVCLVHVLHCHCMLTYRQQHVHIASAVPVGFYQLLVASFSPCL